MKENPLMTRFGLGPICVLAILDSQRPQDNQPEDRDDERASEGTENSSPYPQGEEKNIPEEHRPEPEIDQQPDPREKEIDLDDAAGPGQAGIGGEKLDRDTDLIDTPRPDDN